MPMICEKSSTIFYHGPLERVNPAAPWDGKKVHCKSLVFLLTYKEGETTRTPSRTLDHDVRVKQVKTNITTWRGFS